MEVIMSTWSAEDIKQLSKYYTMGFPIKEIANILHRSPTALYKAISRFHLQSLKPPKDAPIFDENGLPVPTAKERREKSYLKKLFSICMNEEWVDFSIVLEYLREQNINVEFLNQRNKYGEDLYALNRKIFVASQVLLVANRLRVEEKKSPFKVQNVSW